MLNRWNFLKTGFYEGIKLVSRSKARKVSLTYSDSQEAALLGHPDRTSALQLGHVLKSRFGHDEFRPLQREAVECALAGRDSLILMPTGGGKSLCYQLPALVLDGLTLVISPLIALMKDQVDALTSRGIPAAFINSTLPYPEVSRVRSEVLNGRIKILYVAPERLAQDGFRSFLRNIDLSLIAIDEAHCISEWGHDFRPDYRNLSALRAEFAATPVTALTATATERVRDDIAEQLGMREAQRFVSSFNRPNLNYVVKPKRGAFNSLTQLLGEHRGQAAIVYCFSRQDSEDLATRLSAQGFPAEPYHAGLDAHVRNRAQERFIHDEVPIIVATIAFGMGIDKPDIRLIVHYDLPKSVEGYYQETGRAGRDGMPSDCVLFFSFGDKIKQEFFIDEIEDESEKRNARLKLSQIIAYGDLQTCRRRFLLEYFGEEWNEENCGACDVCLDSQQPADEFDATEIAQKVLSAVIRTNQRFGASHVIAVLRGSKSARVREFGHDRLSVYGIGRDFSTDALKDIAGQLVARGLLSKGGEYPTLSLTPAGLSFLNQRETLSLRRPKLPEQPPQVRRALGLEYDEVLFEKLRHLRTRLADANGVPTYVIFPNETLQQMAAFLPHSPENLGRIDGVGPAKLAEFAGPFLKVIEGYAKTNGLAEKTVPGEPTKPRAPQRLGPTYMETKRLLDDGLSPAEIAQRRGLDPTTVLGHLDRLVSDGVRVDLTPMLPSTDRVATIEAALNTSSTDLLAPVRELLGDAYSYDEIRLVKMHLRQQQAASTDE